MARSRSDKVRGTRVTRHFYWQDYGEPEGTPLSEAGCWRLVPVGQSHRQRIVERDPDTGEEIGTMGVYEAKGWTARRRMAADDPRLELLPKAWEAMEKGDAKGSEVHRRTSKRPSRAHESARRTRPKAATSEELAEIKAELEAKVDAAAAAKPAKKAAKKTAKKATAKAAAKPTPVPVPVEPGEPEWPSGGDVKESDDGEAPTDG